ncbi:MAG: DUF1631 family protein [Betaproteobacteria bacterium]
MPAQFSNPDSVPASPSATPFDVLLAQCRDLVSDRLGQAMAGMLDKVDDALGTLISETRDAGTQKLYAQTRDKALAQREAIEKQFRARFLREFQQRSNRVKKIGDSFSEIDLSSLELELVGDDDLDETLKFNAMASRLRQYCDEELIALDQRVGVLLGDASLQAEDNPFTPQAICDAYKDTCRQIDSNVEVRMVMLRLFDDHVADEIRAVYKAVNALLVQNSILPKIRMAARKDATRPPARPPAEAPKAAAPAEQKPADGEQDLFSILKNLRASSASAPAQAAGGSAAVGATGVAGGVPAMMQGTELLGLLTRIQLGDASAMPGNMPTAAPGVDPGLANVLSGLKSTSVGAGMNQLDMMTLDIMSLVFDQLFDDPDIPVGVKGLIGRLQIPMLKVAIADKTFFSKKTHPARQLLDALGEMSLRLPADFNATSPLYGRMEVVLQQLIDGFGDKMEIFDGARAQLETFIAEEDKRVELESESAAIRVEQKERLALAKAVAQAEIKMRARVADVPREVMEFLAQQWVQLLLVVHVTEGEDSEAWKSALETMDLLIWSVEPKDSADERSDLVTVVPELLKGLAAGLRAASIEDAVRNSFFADLKKLHDALIGKPLADATQEPQAERASDAAGTEAPPSAEIIAAPAPALDVAQSANAPDMAATLPLDVAPATMPAVETAVASGSELAAADSVTVPVLDARIAPTALPPVAAEPVVQPGDHPALETTSAPDEKPASLPDSDLASAPAARTDAAPASEKPPAPDTQRKAEPVAKSAAVPDLDFAPTPTAKTQAVLASEGAAVPEIEMAPAPVAKTDVPDLDFAPVPVAKTQAVPTSEGVAAPEIETAPAPIAKTAAVPDLDFAPTPVAPPAEPVEEPVLALDLDFAPLPVAQTAAAPVPALEPTELPGLEFTPASAPAEKPVVAPAPSPAAAPAFLLDMELPSVPAAPAQAPKPADMPDLVYSPAPAPAPASKPAVAPAAEFVSLPELNFAPAPAAAPTPAPAAMPELKFELEPAAKPSATPAPTAGKSAAQPTPAPVVRPAAAPTAQPVSIPVAKTGAAPTARPAPAPVAKPGAAPIAQPPPAAARPGAAPPARPAPRAGAPTANPATAAPVRQAAPASVAKAATPAAPHGPAQGTQRGALPVANPAAAPRPPAPGTPPAARAPAPSAQRAAATPAARPVAAAAGVRPPPASAARPPSMPPSRVPISARPQQPRAESKVSETLDFTAPVTIENPFGGGKVEVEDLDFTAKPAAGTAGAKQATAAELPRNLAIGSWVGVRGKDEKEARKSAKLSFISPLKTRYLFVDKQGKTTLDCTRAELARRFQIGEVIIMDKVPDVPLFDRITDGLVGKLGGGAVKK